VLQRRPPDEDEEESVQMHSDSDVEVLQRRPPDEDEEESTQMYSDSDVEILQEQDQEQRQEQEQKQQFNYNENISFSAFLDLSVSDSEYQNIEAQKTCRLSAFKRLPGTLRNEDPCSICLQTGKSKTLLPCLHFYCDGCAKSWFILHDKCPECRSNIFYMLKRNDDMWMKAVKL